MKDLLELDSLDAAELDVEDSELDSLMPLNFLMIEDSELDLRLPLLLSPKSKTPIYWLNCGFAFHSFPEPQ